MSEEIPSYLRDVLRLIVDGYSHEAISRKLFISTATVHTYVKRLKEYLQDEPELQDFNISPQKALVLIGKRYFEVSNDAYPQNAPSYEMVNTSLSSDEEEVVIPHRLMPEIIASSPYFIDWFTSDLEGISQVRIQR